MGSNREHPLKSTFPFLRDNILGSVKHVKMLLNMHKHASLVSFSLS